MKREKQAVVLVGRAQKEPLFGLPHSVALRRLDRIDRLEGDLDAKLRTSQELEWN